MDRIFHEYNKWECYKNGFYNNYTKKKYSIYKDMVIYVFSSQDITQKYMIKVLNEWHYSCENFLTNQNINKVAWLGQAACNIYGKVPNLATMAAWSDVKPIRQNISNMVASKLIDKWTKQKQLEIILKSGNQDVITKEYQTKLLLN